LTLSAAEYDWTDVITRIKDEKSDDVELQSAKNSEILASHPYEVADQVGLGLDY